MALRKTSQPVTKKGAVRQVEVAVAAWLDLLGYGSLLAEVGFNPTHARAKQAIARLHAYQEIVGSLSSRYFPTFILNDGSVAFRDMSPRSRSVTFDFLHRAVSLHRAVNAADREAGFPGARMVIACGFRVRRIIDFRTFLHGKLASTIRRRISEKEISVEQGLYEALKARSYSDMIPELQANFALTRAYLVDQAGSKAGFSGPNCFIDLSMFSDPRPDWINFDGTITWASHGMSAEFGRLNSIDRRRAGKARHVGALAGFEIAQRLDPNTDTIVNMKRRRIGNTRWPLKK